MKIETKHLLIAILTIAVGALGYYFLIQRPQEIKLRCMEIAKDFGQRHTGLYRTYQNDGYFINRSMYNNCIEQAGLSTESDEQK